MSADINQESDSRDAVTTTGLLNQHALELDSPLWRFAVTLWQDDSISEHCLALQGKGWNVIRLLCAGWQASLGLAFREEPADVIEWRVRMTARLRATRQALPKDLAAAASLRQTLAQAELEAERIELALAYALLPGSGKSKPARDSAVKTETPAHLMLQNLEAAAPERDPMDADTSRLVNALSHRISMQLRAQRQKVGH